MLKHSPSSEKDSVCTYPSTEYFVRSIVDCSRLSLWVASTRKFILEGRELSVRIRETLFQYVKKQMVRSIWSSNYPTIDVLFLFIKAEGNAAPSFTSTLLEARGNITGGDDEEALIKSTAAILYGGLSMFGY